jgi:hypothetical protein
MSNPMPKQAVVSDTAARDLRSKMQGLDREQAAAAYGDNATRLGTLKRRFDPDGAFTSAISLPEA